MRKRKETHGRNSHHESSPKNNFKNLVGPSSTHPPGLSLVQASTSDKTKKLVQRTPIITTRQKPTQKTNLAQAPPTYPPSLSRMQPNAFQEKKSKKLLQRTPKNNLPKITQNLSCTMHQTPPTHPPSLNCLLPSTSEKNQRNLYSELK